MLGDAMLKVVVPVAGLMAATFCAPLSAQAPVDKPFAMRGVILGISREEFLSIPIPNDDDRYYKLQTWCSIDALPRWFSVEISEEDRDDGIVNCHWFSTMKGLDRDGGSHHFVNIGAGQAQPVFRFLPDADGELRLFRITSYANIQYYAAIRDALTRGYGKPVTIVQPFKTLSGSEFTSATSLWDNGFSTITLVERCGHLERYCLTYDHSELVKIYEALEERRASAAATKI